MKKVLGLAIGTTSIGWAFVNEAEKNNEISSINKLGVRAVPITKDEENDFQKGKSYTKNSERTIKRGMRRNFDRYKTRRDRLIKILKKNKIISSKSILNEDGRNTTYSTYKLRAAAVSKKIQLDDFAKVLLMLNKKRGYKSNSKNNNENDGTLINGIETAKYLRNNNITPGQYIYDELTNGVKSLPDIYRSDFENELNKIWSFQKTFYPSIMTDKLKNELTGKTKGTVWKILEKPFNINGIKLEGKKKEILLEKYRLRNIALNEKIDLERLAVILQDVIDQINKTNNFLGNISDRSKELFFLNQTIGQYLYERLVNDERCSLKNIVFPRQDHIAEFETIWEKQSEFYNELNNKLKTEIRDVIIFFQ